MCHVMWGTLLFIDGGIFGALGKVLHRQWGL